MDTQASTPYTRERNMRLIDLAFDCVYLNSAEKEKTLKLLEEKYKDEGEVCVLDIFRQEEYVSDKRIERLLSLDEHLQIRSRDQQFGMLAVANEMASQEAVANALVYQKKYFENNRMNMKIGDILVGNGTITGTDRISILLTQNRIKDEDLLEAFNEIGETPAEKEIINKRFGVFAIKKKGVTIEQVNAALAIQEDEKKRDKNFPRFIGLILKETAGLSDDDILEILLEQKQFEKRRLDLEKALYTVKSEIKISKKLNKLFEYNVSKDGLEASVKKRTQIDEDIPVYEFLIWLKKVGITFGIADDAVLEDFIQNAKVKSPVIIARGYPADPCVDESIQFYTENGGAAVEQIPDPTQAENPEPEQPDEQQSDEQQSDEHQPEESKPEEPKPEESESAGKKPETSEPGDKADNPKVRQDKKDIPSALDEKGKKENDLPDFIETGSLLARIIPGKQGKSGKDVTGHLIQPGKPSLCMINAGSGVIKKGSAFLAQVSGRPMLKSGTTLVVEPVIKKHEKKIINTNINQDTQDTYETAVVEVNGTINPGAVLRCHSLKLHGALKGSVICSGDVDVNGDIGTDEKPKDADTIPRAEIFCHGSIRTSKSVKNAKIQTHGKLLAFNSTLTGSEVIACKGMTIKNVVKGDDGPSLLWFGLKPDDKIISLDRTIEAKTPGLSVLKKEAEIAQLKEKYEKDLKEETDYQTEQAVLKNLIEIIEAPELYQHEGLEDKIRYLKGLPDFSSVKACYLNLPETKKASEFLRQVLKSVEKMTLENAVKQFKKKIDREPENESEDEDAIPKEEQIETEFKARMAAFENEIAGNSEEITAIENEIKGLQALRTKLASALVRSLSRSASSITIKNQCEKGTVIKGKIASLVMEKTLYNIQLKEIPDPKTNTVSIVIEAD